MGEAKLAIESVRRLIEVCWVYDDEEEEDKEEKSITGGN